MSEKSILLTLAFVALVGLLLFRFRDVGSLALFPDPATAESAGVSNLTYNQPAYYAAPLNANVMPGTTSSIVGTPVPDQSSLNSAMNSYCGCA